jgi:hypothetical protein
MSYPPPPEESPQPGQDQPEPGPPGHGQGQAQQGSGQGGHGDFGQPGYGQQPPYSYDPNQPLYGHGPGQYPPGHPAAQQPYGYAQAPYQYGSYYALSTKPEHPEAVPSLVIGVIALGAGLMPFLLGLPLLLGPWAWIKSRRTLGEIDVSGGQLGGRGQAKGGYICGVIATALLILWVMGLSVLVAITVLAHARTTP